MQINSTANIIAKILVNVAVTGELEYAGDRDRAVQAHAVWEGLQAAFAYAAKAEGLTRRVACRRYAKTARAMALAAGAPREWLPTVPQIVA